MSLQAAAQHMASQGRGPDTTLVHMSPKEVRSLQELAMAHGGSLSVNPQTGLPEAGFLSSLLPMLIGAGLTAATGGAAAPGLMGLSNAATIGLGVGGLQALRTGSLKKGLMAGLGAYGGAGLMGSVMGAGTEALQAAASTPATGVAGTAIPTASTSIMPAIPTAPVTEMAGLVTPGDANLLNTSFGVDPSALNVAPVSSTPVYPGTSGALGSGTSSFGAVDLPTAGVRTIPKDMSYVMGTPTPNTMMTQPGLPAVVDRSTYPLMDTTKAGFEAIGKDPSKIFNKENLKYGLTAAAPLVGSMFETKTGTPPPVDREQMRFAFDPGRLTPPTRTGDVGEYTYFRPSYTRLAAKGGLMDLYAEGGETVSDYIYDPETQLYSRAKSAPQQARASSGVAGPYTMGSPAADPNTFANLTNAEKAAFFEQNPTMAALTQLGQNAFNLTSLGLLSQFVDPVGNAQASFNATPGAQANMNAMNLGMDIGQTAAGGGGGNAVSGPGADPSMDSAGMSPADSGNAAADAAASPYASGGISHLGDYSDGGRLLRGPGDGVSDSIPATIANKRPARLADGEFVVPARIVSELGNGSTEAGARKLYAMMDRIQKNRTKSVGKGKVAVNSRSEKLLPA